MTEGYTKHLTNLHAKQTIPAEILNDILREVSPEPVLSKQRLIAGEANEVYDVSFADGLRVIARISRDDDKNFAQEQWAIRECGLRGVPVPEVLGVWHRPTQGQSLTICIQRKIEGVLLPNADLPHHVLRQIVVQAGELLSRIHAVPVKGFGYINGKGEGEFLTPQAEIDAFVKMESEFHVLAQRLDLSSRDMSRALRLVVDAEQMVRSVEPCLTHNDFCAKHILVANGTVSGIIDFGEVAGSEPLSDFVRWAYYDAACFPLEWLQEGYTNKQVFDTTFTQRLHVKRIAFSLWVLRWYDMHGYAEGVADARAKFLRDIEWR
jgi:aminoglycoside phosphotransferase (APT) family kinase protein